MTEEQERAFILFIYQLTRCVLLSGTGPGHLENGALKHRYTALCDSFGYTHENVFNGEPEKPEPEEEPEEPREWRVVPHPLVSSSYSVQDKHGTYWRDKDGNIWSCATWRKAGKRARELNRVDART